MAFIHWRFFDALDKNYVNISKIDLIFAGLLLISGGIVLGTGITSFAFLAVGLAVSIIGGVMLFGGIVLTIRTCNAIADALLGTTRVSQQ